MVHSMNNLTYGYAPTDSLPPRKDNGVSDTDLLKLLDILTLLEASALIAGCSPNKVRENCNNDGHYYYLDVDRDDPANANDVFDISLKAIVKTINRGLLKAKIAIIPNRVMTKDDLKSDWLMLYEIDEAKTTVTRDDLKYWLEQRGVYPTMLFPNGKKDDYMNPNHPNYAPKLAVCVKAWEVAQTGTQGKRPKQFMIDWIAENGKNYGLENTGKKEFENLASISNWDTKGGRASSEPTPLLEPKIDNKEILENLTTVHQKLAVNLDDEPPTEQDNSIPF